MRKPDIILNYYYIAINEKRLLHYPFRFSNDRRLNFTLAHEFGHILDHLIISKELKTPSQQQIEEEEANEFAGSWTIVIDRGKNPVTGKREHIKKAVKGKLKR
jgi:hypothetical protein